MNQYGAGPSEQDIAAGLAAYFGCIFIFAVIMIALQIWLFYRILKKAGMNPWLSLLVLIGGLGTIVLMFMLALGDWPALRGAAAPVAYQPAYTPPAPAPVQVPPVAPQPPAPPVAPQPPVPPAAPQPPSPEPPAGSGEPPVPPA